jgi:hypothetical protein
VLEESGLLLIPRKLPKTLVARGGSRSPFSPARHSTGETQMVTITRKSNDPCLICGRVEHNVEVKGSKPRIIGPMCLNHAYERLAEEKNPGEDPTTAQTG